MTYFYLVGGAFLVGVLLGLHDRPWVDYGKGGLGTGILYWGSD